MIQMIQKDQFRRANQALGIDRQVAYPSAGMDDAPPGLSIELYFSEDKAPEVLRMMFRVRSPEKEHVRRDFERARKKDMGDKGDDDRFEWSSGTKGFILALLDYKLGYRKQEISNIYEFKGATTNSPAASACGAIGKQRWLSTAFGFEPQTQRKIAKEVFSVHDDRSAKTIAFGIDADRLPPGNIQVFRVKSLKALPQKEIQRLYETVNQGWKPHHQRSREKKPPSPQDEPATESDRPANWLRKQREEELKIAKGMLTVVADKMQSRQWNEAAAQCQAAEKLFSGANSVWGEIECRVKLSAICSQLGWKVENLAWLLKTVKLIVNRGSPQQILECLVDLALYLPDALSEEGASEFLNRLQATVPLAGETLSDAQHGSKSALRQFLLLATGRILLATGIRSELELAVTEGPNSADFAELLQSPKIVQSGKEQKEAFLLAVTAITLAAGLPSEEVLTIRRGSATDYDNVIALQERVVRATTHTRPALHAMAILGIGICYFNKGRLKEALIYTKRAKEFGEMIGDEETKRAFIAASETLLQTMLRSGADASNFQKWFKGRITHIYLSDPELDGISPGD